MNRSVTTLLAILLVAPVAIYAGGFQLNEHGARAMAQGGAFAARASDPSAIFFNPAGLSWLSKTQVTAGATIIMPSFKFRGPTNYNMNEEVKMESQVFTPINVYATHTFDEGSLKGLGIGFGVYNPYGLGTKWDDNWIGRAITQETLLETFYLSPTISYAYRDLVSVGVGLNYVISNVKLRQAITVFEPPMNLKLTGDGSGMGFNAGILIRPHEMVSLGFTYRSEAKIEYDGDADFGVTIPSQKALFPGGAVKTSVKMPATYFAGIAFMPMENLEIEFDYQGIQWSSYDKLEIDFVNDATTDPTKVIKQADVVSPKNYKDSYILRAGLEYNCPMSGMKIRAGYLYDHTPVPDEHLEPLLPDADRNGFNFGLGYKILPNLTVDVSYLFLQWKQRTTTKTTNDPAMPDDKRVSFDGTYNGNAHLIGMNFSYSF